MTSLRAMTRWAFVALTLFAAPVAAAEDHAGDQLAACVIGSAVVRIERWNEPYAAAVDQAWIDCDPLIDRLPPDPPDAELSEIDNVIHFVDHVLFELFEEEARTPTASGYNLTPPDTF